CYCTSLQEITIPDAVETIGSYVFEYCTSLKEITIPDGITSLGSYVLYGCTALTTVKLPDSLMKIDEYAFANCSALTEISIPEGVAISTYAFSNCTKLETVVLGSNITISNYSFTKCDALTTVEFGKGVIFTSSSFPDLSMSGSCGENITYELDFVNRTFKLEGSGTMENYTEQNPAPWHNKITNILELEINGEIISIGDYAFDGAKNLLFFELPKTITTIGTRAFRENKELTYVEIPENVISIGEDAFVGCENMEQFIFCGNAPEMYGIILSDAEDVDVYIPTTAIGWSDTMVSKFLTEGFKYFDNTVDSIGIFLLLDTSGSMKNKMDQLKTAVNAFIKNVGGRINKADISIMEYAAEIKSSAKYTTCVPKLQQYVKKMSSEGGTEYHMALESAYNYIKTESKAEKNYIVMFSDGEPNDAEQPIYDLSDLIRKDYPIFTVGLASDSHYIDILKRIAGDYRYFEAEDITGLTEAFAKLSGDLERTENTVITMNRNNMNVDLLSERMIFVKGTTEKVNLSVLPSIHLGSYKEIALVQGENIILKSENGEFTEIRPGLLFDVDLPIYVITYDWNGEELERIEVKVTVKNGLIVTYYLNDGTNVIYKTVAIQAGENLIPPEEPSRTYYKFSGWYENKNGSGLEYFSSQNKKNRESVMKNINLYAKWTQFDPNIDAWSFRNSYDTFGLGNYEITPGDYKKLEESVQISGNYSSWSNVERHKNEEWGGSCFGMSSAAVLAYHNYFDINAFQASAVNVHTATINKNIDGDNDVGPIESMINFNQLRQSVGNLTSLDYYLQTESEDIEDVIQAFKKANGPVVVNIGLYYPIYENSQYVGELDALHAVVGYEFYQIDNTSWQFKVYDCSKKDKVYTVTIKNNNGSYTKECTEWTNDWAQSKPPLTQEQIDAGLSAGNYTRIKIHSASTAEDLNMYPILIEPETLSETQSVHSENKEEFILETSSLCFSITDGTHSAEVLWGKKQSGDLDILAYGNISEVDQKASYLFKLPVLFGDAYYSITPTLNLSDFETTLRFDDSDTGFYSSVNTSSMGTYTLYANGTVQTKFDEPAEQKVTVLSSIMETPWYSVDLQTASTGITAKPYSDKVVVTSLDETTMTVKAKSSFNSLTFEDVPVSEQGTEIIGTDEDVCRIVHNGEEWNTDYFGYFVIFDSRLGTSVPSLTNVLKGSLLTKPEDPKREGYFFRGWYKDEEYTEKWNFDTDTVKEDTVLYAGWSTDPNYFITIYFNLPYQEQQSITVPNGFELTEEYLPGGITEWFKDNACTKEWAVGEAITRNMILYAKNWNKESDDTLVLNKTILHMLPEETIQLTVTSQTSVGSLTWVSADENIAKVDENGFVTAIADGITTITVQNSNGNVATCEVIVVPQCIYVKGFASYYIYTGTAIKPEISVYDSGTLLTNKTDYTVTYKNTTKAYHVEDPENPTAADKKKAPQIIIKSNSKGNYKGSKTIYFSIDPLDINDEQITVDELSVQSGTKPVSPVPVVYFNGKKLKNKTDFTVDYNGWNQLDSGDITIKIQGKGNFQGTRDVTVHVASSNLISVAKLKVTAKTLKYAELNGDNFIEEISSAVTVKNGKKAVPADVYHFEDIPEDYKKTGTVKFTLVGNEAAGFYGKKTVTVKITGIALTDKKIKAAVPSYVYTGEPQVLGNDFSIKYSEETLEEGKDYAVESYSNNINAGTATVVLRGIGNYTGTRKITFKITPADASEREIHVDDAYYTKGGSKPKVTIEGLTEGTDYTVKYANNKAVTTPNTSKLPTATITFKGNYKGTVTRDFNIAPKPINKVSITSKDKVYSDKTNAWKSAPILKDTDGKTLKAGTDYEKTISYTTVDGEELPAVVEAGTVVKVTVTGKGNYTGTAETYYRILETGKDITKMTFKIANKEYTGSSVTLSEDDILSIKIGKTEQNLTLGTDYEIASYTNNIKKGTAKVTFRGKGEYGGEKTVSFKIGQRSIVDYWQGVKNFFSKLF
ncbi:MAG: leucine-rich repeat protein, partial [Solobacterium sp.]|nr:leucine-rich repeat protein [Solobacterium sp.]